MRAAVFACNPSTWRAALQVQGVARPAGAASLQCSAHAGSQTSCNLRICCTPMELEVLMQWDACTVTAPRLLALTTSD
jgi:hypothetical protein